MSLPEVPTDQEGSDKEKIECEYCKKLFFAEEVLFCGYWDVWFCEDCWSEHLDEVDYEHKKTCKKGEEYEQEDEIIQE